jgi:hypothetical protein
MYNVLVFRIISYQPSLFILNLDRVTAVFAAFNAAPSGRVVRSAYDLGPGPLEAWTCVRVFLSRCAVYRRLSDGSRSRTKTSESFVISDVKSNSEQASETNP